MVPALIASTLVAAPATGRPASEDSTAVAAAVPPLGQVVPSVDKFGRTEGQFSVSDDGAAQYNLPMWTPDGRGKSAPQLSLSYDSRGGNGVVGMGWSLTGLSTVTRCPRTIAQDGFTDGVHFTRADAFCLGGNRLIPLSTAPGPEREFRTEVETFARIKAFGMDDEIPDSFRVENKDGTISTFGGTDDARVGAFRLVPGTEPNTLVRESATRVTVAWSLNRFEDRNGNAATVEYERVEGTEAQLWHVQARVKAIQYQPNREVRFIYQDRQDPIESFAVGVHSLEPKRLDKVQMFAGRVGAAAELMREYRLTYATSPLTKRSQLHQVVECDGGAGASCLKPLVFSWSGFVDYAFDEIQTDVRDAGQYPEGSGRDNRILVIDIDGDGRQDILYPSTEEPVRAGERQQWRIRRSTGNGFEPAIRAGFHTPILQCTDEPIGHSECTSPNGQIRLGDHNLDGRTDVLVWVGVIDGNPETKQWKLYVSNGTSFVPDPSGMTTLADTGNDPDPVAFADLDGNGAQDIITAPWDRVPGEEGFFNIDGPWKYRLNDGRGEADSFGPWVDTGRMLPLTAVNFGGRGPMATAGTVQDVNADNRMDFIGLDGGWGLGATGGVEDRGPNPVFRSSRFDSYLGDVNGDGFHDAINAQTDACEVGPRRADLKASLFSGNGFAPYSESPVYWDPLLRCINTHDDPSRPPVFEPDPGFDRGVRVVDFNGDGNDDVLVFRSGHPRDISDDVLGAQLYIWRNGRFERSHLSAYAGNAQNEVGFSASTVLDFNGDGEKDILHAEGDHLRLMVRRSTGSVDQIVGFGDSLNGGRTEIEYTTLADRAVHTPLEGFGYPLAAVKSGGSIVKRHSVATKVSNIGEILAWDTYDHTYRGARMDLQGRGWLGVNSHTVHRLQTGATIRTVFNNSTRDAGVTSVYPFAFTPIEVGISVVDRPNGREHRTVSAYDGTLERRGRGYTVEPDFSRVTELERAVGEEDFEILRRTTTLTTFDAFGNADLVESATDGGRSAKQDLTFTNDTGSWLIGLPTRQLTTGCSTVPGDCRTRESTFRHDASGNLRVTVQEPNQPALKLTTTTERGEFGNIVSITKQNNAGEVRRETFEYNDADRLHPTDTINALGHRSTKTTHSGLGVTLDTTDPNGVLTTMKYDRFGRLLETNRSDGSFERVNHFADPDRRERVETVVSGGGEAKVRLDRLGRESELSQKTFSGGFATTFTEYDDLGRVHRKSRPTLSGQTAHFTTTAYDNRDRVVSQTAADNVQVRHSYFNRKKTTIDAKGEHSFVVTNADGDVEASFEPDPIVRPFGTLETKFEYGPFGVLTKVTAPDTTARVMRYDVLGRQERLEDPAAGTIATMYNAFGEVATQTNAAAEVTEFRYDALGRVLKTITPDGEAINKWDTAPNGIGKITNAKSADGVGIDYRYDPRGTPQSTQWSIGGNVFKVEYDYDVIGRQSTMTYPAVLGTTSRLKVAYVYNQHGYLSQVKDSTGLTGARITAPCDDADRAEGRCLWTANTRDAAGQLTRETYGSGVVTDNMYKPETGMLDRATATGPGTIGKLADLDYEYDVNRNVRTRADLVNGYTDTYDYDQLNRIRTWKSTRGPTQLTAATYLYDKVGNIKTETFDGAPERNVTYTYGENGAPKHALTSRNTTTFSYDLAGRQTSGDRRSITYTTANLPKTITWGQQSEKTTTFAYDPNGARVSKVDNEQTSISIPGLLDRHNPAGTGSAQVHNIHHVTVDGRVVAQVNRIQDITQPTGPVTLSQTTYLHQDLQGSTHLVTNPAGREVGNEGGFVQDLRYDPWGQRLDANNVPLGRQRRVHRIGYTSHDHDDELGLIDMKGRIYSPIDRRFTTPDPIIQDPLSSQNHNRYVYVQDNPTTFTDPAGLWREDHFYDCSGASGSFCDDIHSDFFNPRSGGSWAQINDVWRQISGDAAAELLRLKDSEQAGDTIVVSVTPNTTSSYPAAYVETIERGDTATIDDSGGSLEQIADTYFWVDGEGTHWIWLPSDEDPRQVPAITWEYGKQLAAGGAKFWAPTAGDIVWNYVYWTVNGATTVPSGLGVAKAAAALGNAIKAGASIGYRAVAARALALKVARDHADDLVAKGGRVPTMSSGAVDMRTGKFWAGHSKEGAPIPDTLKEVLPGKSVEHWTVTNCAEVNACAKALASGARLEDLQVITVHTRSGNPVLPCGNCTKWVPPPVPYNAR